MAGSEKYLRPEVIRQVARLDLRAKFIVEGFLTGLHASPFQGFSVEFSEHRKYVAGDDLKDLDWNVYAKTDRYYIKKFEAETNLTGDLLTDPQPVLESLHHLRHRGNEVILFHILDEAEVHFPFDGVVEFEDVEEHDRLTIDARSMRSDYLQTLGEFQQFYRTECQKANIDYVPMDTSVSFDKALMQYLVQRQKRF